MGILVYYLDADRQAFQSIRHKQAIAARRSRLVTALQHDIFENARSGNGFCLPHKVDRTANGTARIVGVGQAHDDIGTVCYRQSLDAKFPTFYGRAGDDGATNRLRVEPIDDDSCSVGKLKPLVPMRPSTSWTSMRS